ncbi:MAG: SAM-dependent methyltransferase [Methyloceanibacter sp.]|nr:SAM-dependent methyltransferase [Methyloceanibacter sp.]
MAPTRTSSSMESTLLSVRLKAQIARIGPISVERYMDVCLADTKAGYYPSKQPIGAAGDFITAPEVSQMFGELLGLWAYAVWQSMGSPSPVILAELGPGRGTLMADALRALRRLPGFLDSAKVALVETSPPLRQAQEQALADCGADVSWHEAIETVPGGPAIVIANEFIDALPIRQLVWRDGQWRERCVTIAANGGFAFCEGGSLPVENLRRNAELKQLPNGSILEVRPAANAVVAALAERAKDAPLAALIIDYGHEATECGDTLQAISRHKFANPLEAPGNVDLTAHVDFGALKDAARNNGLLAFGPKPQRALLMDLGLEARLDRLCEDAGPEQCEALVAGAERLVDPAAMGVLFKALAITSKDLPPPPAFQDNA